MGRLFNQLFLTLFLFHSIANGLELVGHQQLLLNAVLVFVQLQNLCDLVVIVYRFLDLLHEFVNLFAVLRRVSATFEPDQLVLLESFNTYFLVGASFLRWNDTEFVDEELDHENGAKHVESSEVQSLNIVVLCVLDHEKSQVDGKDYGIEKQSHSEQSNCSDRSVSHLLRGANFLRQEKLVQVEF